MRDDGDSKLSDLVTLSEKVISRSSTSGQQFILCEVECCKSDWRRLVADISQVCVHL